ncbi:MAG: ATP-binding cassette domain-containing protein [Chitinophagales bacterium]|jgi:ABC-2 type transport system ATP-binding protein|nr:ATP-binding cassette domain-containing protein [Chitinophagales bacterium]
MSFLSIEHVSKTFGDYKANDDISLSIQKGKIFGLLGPNGAGKTTLIRMITRILLPDSGTILFDGKPHNDKHTERIGYMPEERGLYKNMKVYDHLVYLAKLKGLSASDAKTKTVQWLQRLAIDSWRDKKIEELSKGMSQKVQFIGTVIHEPELLILDEPFSGLDPINSQIIDEEIHRLKAEGKTIIFSTHRMEQVDQICDEIGLINKGHLILHGDVMELKSRFKQSIYEVKFSESAENIDFSGIAVVEQSANRMVLRANEKSNAELLRLLLDRGLEITSFQEILPTVQQIFIQQVNSSTHA